MISGKRHGCWVYVFEYCDLMAVTTLITMWSLHRQNTLLPCINNTEKYVMDGVKILHTAFGLSCHRGTAGHRALCLFLTPPPPPNQTVKKDSGEKGLEIEWIQFGSLRGNMDVLQRNKALWVTVALLNLLFSQTNGFALVRRCACLCACTCLVQMWSLGKPLPCVDFHLGKLYRITLEDLESIWRGLSMAGWLAGQGGKGRDECLKQNCYVEDALRNPGLRGWEIETNESRRG